MAKEMEVQTSQCPGKNPKVMVLRDFKYQFVAATSLSLGCKLNMLPPNSQPLLG